jgi:two-component system sensor histidine kinase VicK
MPHSTPDPSALEAEIQRLRTENDRLRRQRAEPEGSQDRFRAVFENSPLGQKIIDPDLTICQANEALALMLGFERAEEVVGRRILEFAHPDHAADWIRLQERLWAHRLPNFSLETCLIRVDGSSFWCQVTSVLFADNGRELGYTTLEDISERKKLALSHGRLYDAQEAILHLAAHDLKAPVNNIRMMVDLFLKQQPGTTSSTCSS